jgi:hypothetical protein
MLVSSVSLTGDPDALRAFVKWCEDTDASGKTYTIRFSPPR